MTDFLLNGLIVIINVFDKNKYMQNDKYFLVLKYYLRRK